MDRRAFLNSAAALACAPDALAGAATRLGAETGRRLARWRGYEQAFVVDFLASPGLFNVPGLPPLTDEMVRNAVASGITAVNLTVNSLTGDAFAETVSTIATWEGRIAAHADAFLKVRTVADVEAAKKSGRLGVVYGFQDATALEQDLDRLRLFYDLGVRVIQLTYNVRNLVGDGCLEPGNAGLSRFGLQVVERMNELGMIVDLSHCGQRTTADGVAASKRPVGITHTGCAALAPHPRNKRDEELRAMAAKGGVVGIYIIPFITPGRQPTTDDVVDHIEHALKVCGEDHVGIGSDLSITPIEPTPEYWRTHREFVLARRKAGTGAPAEDENLLFYTPELNFPRRLELIADRMAARRHPDARIEKVVGGNWMRLMREVWI